MDGAANNSVRGKLSGRARASLRAALVCIVSLGSTAARSSLGQPATGEYQVKAAFLFHFAQLVDWPSGALDGGDRSLNLCIFDDEPGRQQFQSVIEGKTTGTRVLHVRLLAQPEDYKACNILFLSRTEARGERAVLNSLRGLPVLTVGDSGDFLTDGGMIRFHIEQDQIRFDINLGAADGSHLKISSRLLLLATAVTGGSTGAEKRTNAYQ
jgi:hypothetical protein